MSTVRKATIDDLGSLASLFNDYRAFYNKGTDLAGAKTFIQDRLMRGDAEIFVTDDNGVLTGFVQLYPLFSSTRMKKLWLLNDLFVRPESRGKGHSVALINHAKILCRDTGACGLLLETAKSNAIGNALYPRAGFVLDNDHNYYSWDN